MNQATFDEICQFRYDGIWCQSTTGNAVHILCYDEENNRKYGQEGVMQENAIMDSVNYEFLDRVLIYGHSIIALCPMNCQKSVLLLIYPLF